MPRPLAKRDRRPVNLTALLFAMLFVAVVFILKNLFESAVSAIQHHTH